MVDGGECIVEATWRSVSNIMQKVWQNIHCYLQLYQNYSHPNSELLKRIFPQETKVRMIYFTVFLCMPHLSVIETIIGFNARHFYFIVRMNIIIIFLRMTRSYKL